MTNNPETETRISHSLHRLAMRFPDLSPAALRAMGHLYSGTTCEFGEEVVRELGKAGLAYRFDLRSRSRRIVLSSEGERYATAEWRDE